MITKRFSTGRKGEYFVISGKQLTLMADEYSRQYVDRNLFLSGAEIEAIIICRAKNMAKYCSSANQLQAELWISISGNKGVRL